MNNVEAVLYSKLTSFAGVTALVADRVYPLLAPQDITRPFITYQRISSPRIKNLQGASYTAQTRFQIDCYALSYMAARELSGQVRLALDGWSNLTTAVAIKGSSLINDSDFPVTETDPKLYRVMMEFLITHDEAQS